MIQLYSKDTAVFVSSDEVREDFKYSRKRVLIDARVRS